MTAPPLPKYAITVCQPWAWLILNAGKDVENRTKGVATTAKRHVGERIAISVSRSVYVDGSAVAVTGATARGEIAHTFWVLRQWGLVGSLRPASYPELTSAAGHVIGTVMLRNVRSPPESGRVGWHMRGQWGLVLADPAPIEPILCTGGQGFWKLVMCAECGQPYPDGRPCRHPQARTVRPRPKNRQTGFDL